MRRTVLAAAVLALVSCGSGQAPDPWRADEAQLLGRVERLAGAGDVDAAGGVLGELERRGAAAQLDRGRVALARGLLAAGRPEDALTRLRQVAWADKAPAIAGELVGLELAIRWRGLLDGDGVLRSGMLPPRDDPDSDHGRPGGAWQSRRDAFAAIAAALAGPARMVEREGGRVPLPADAGLLALARYAHGAVAWSDTAAALGDPAAWPPVVALAAVRLHLAEHDPVLALAAAEGLWRGHGASPEADAAYRELRTWQLRRRAANFLRLWAYPGIDARLDALAASRPQADATAKAAVAGEGDLGGAAMARSLREQVLAKAEAQVDAAATLDVEAEPMVGPGGTVPERKMEWKLATTYDGIDLALPGGTVAAGEAVPIRYAGDGACLVELWRIADPEAWKRLCEAPSRGDLPAAPVWSTTLDRPGEAAIPTQPEGRYVATATIRACPVVLLRSLRIASTALHIDAGSDGFVAWAVGRGDGRARAALAMAATVELVRSAERAAGAAWAGAEPAWRSGFAEGFTGEADKAWRGSGQEEAFAAGRTAGLAAAQADPARRIELSGATGADGIWRPELPTGFSGRSWKAAVRVAAPGVDEVATVTWGTEAHWTSRAVAWADKPFVRPGETLRFAALLRDHDGERFRLPVGHLAARLELAGERLWSGDLAITATGLVSGEAAVPPGAKEGDVVLVLGDGAAHHLARCERLAVPPLTITVVGDASASVRAGEPHPIRVRLRDAAGEAIAGAEVTCRAGLIGAGEETSTATTDLAGEAVFSVPTPDKAEGECRARITTRREHRNWQVEHRWTVSGFPFPLTVEARDREAEVGGQIRLRLALPQGAQVQARLIDGGNRIGEPVAASGGADGHVEVLVPVPAKADAVEVFCPVLGGGEACQRLTISVRPRPVAGEGDPVACLPERTRLRPGEDLAVAVGCTQSRRDALLLVGARNPVAVRRVAVEDTAARAVLRVAGDWGPTCHVQALAWLPGRGFTASRRCELDVLPVDRLLAVEIALPHDDWRPGERVAATVRIRDWTGAPVAGAAITLGVVDERLYALAEDATPDLLGYFHNGKRPWQMVEGEAVGIGSVHAELWRSVVRRWQPDDDGLWMSERVGGGRRRMLGCAGGARGSDAYQIRTLGGEADPCIAWVAGAVTGADGTVPVSFILPAQAASFRLTARAADASAALLVGEVRTRIAARRGIGLHLACPEVVREGDRLQVLAEVANHQDRERTLRLRWAGEERAVVVGPHARRSVPLDLAVAGAPADAAVVMRGRFLGRRLPIAAELADGDEVIAAETETLLAAPGLPVSRDLRLVAGDDGRLALPETVPAGALVRIAVRAWPDAAARRADELARWRCGDGVRAAAAWLAATAGRERRERLAALWPQLDDGAAAIALRIAAARRGEGAGSIAAVPDGPLGDWLLARGRAAGLALPAPRLRGASGGGAAERAAAAACALAEGWSEGPARWRALRSELAGSDDAVALSIAVDAARLAGDAAAAAELAARLARLPWDDDLVAVLAADLLPEAAAAQPTAIGLVGPGTPVRLDGSVGGTWQGELTAPLAVTAPPGALVAIDLAWQAATTAAVGGEDAPRLELWQGGEDGFRRLAPGAAAWPGRPLLLVVDARHCRAGWSVRTALPALVRAGRGGEALRLRRGDDLGHPLPAADRERLLGAIAGWAEAEPGRRAAARTAVLADLAAVLARCPGQPAGDGERVTAHGSGDGAAGGADQEVALAGGELMAVALTGTGEGACAWPEVLATAPDGGVRRLAGPALRIAAGEVVAAAVAAGNPLAERIRACAERCDPAELDWLLRRDPGSDGAWLQALAALDPAAPHDLAGLLGLPHAGEPGHWTVAAIRRFVDAEPALEEPDPVLVHGEPTLAALVAAAQAARSDRLGAWAALPAPQPPSARPPAALRAWYERLAGTGAWPDLPFAAWIWSQAIDRETLAAMGCDAGIDGWVAFCRRELGLDLRIAAGTAIDLSADGRRVAIPFAGGPALGTRALAAEGLTVVALPGGGYELRALRPDLRALPAAVSFRFEDRPAAEALAAFNELLANRGLPPLRGAGIAIEDLPPVTLSVELAPWDQAAGWLAKQWGLRLEGRDLRN